MDSINTERSYTEYEVTEPTTDFAIGFDNYSGEDKDAIHVTLDGVNLDNLDYTVVRKNAQVLEVTPAITSGVVRLQRETYIDQAFHNFTAGALFSPKAMDENFEQVRHSQQEVNDGFTFLAENTSGVVAAAEAATANAVLATSNANNAAATVQDLVVGKVSAPNVTTAYAANQEDYNRNNRVVSSRPLEYFNNSSTRVGTGNATVDSLALQNAMTSEFAVDLAGLKLKIDRVIDVAKIEACLMSTLPYPKNGSGHALRSATVEVVDDALPVLFNVSQYNARFSGFRIKCSTTNNTTEVIRAARSDYTKADIDMIVNDMVFEYGLRHIKQYGRGLEFQRNVIVGSKDMSISLDWDGRWIPNGQSNDENGTAQRAYTIADIRQHGCLGLIDNIGDYKQEIGNILISNIQGDTGGCLFKGVMNNVLMNNVFSYFHPVVQNQMEIWDGSHDSFINMFNMSGYNVGSVKRVPKKSIEIKCGVLGIDNIVFSNGTIGDSEQWGVSVIGGGNLDITFDNVKFRNTSTTNNELIWLSANAAVAPFGKWDLYFKNCRFTATKPTNATKVFNGTSTSLITIHRDFMTKKSGYATWANPSFTEQSEVTQDPNGA